MNTGIEQAHGKFSTLWISPVVEILRRRPLVSYFLLAYGLQWLWELPMFLIWHQWFFGPWLILSPTLAAFIMAWVTQGKPGLSSLLHRCLAWRNGVQWYLITVLAIPALTIIGLLLMPGGLSAFRVPGPDFLLTYLLAFISKFFAAPFTEEPAWRGFALPRLQERHGPLMGTLILGFLWGLWHLPFWLFIPGHSGAGNGFLGIAIPFIEWLGFIMGFTILITWVFNHTHGSVLPAMLFHTSINATVDNFPASFLPALFPPAVAAHTGIPFITGVCMLLLGVLIVLATHGRLGYDQSRQFGQ